MLGKYAPIHTTNYKTSREESYDFNPERWPDLIKQMLMNELRDKRDGLTMTDLKERLIDHPNLCEINIGIALKELAEEKKINQLGMFYKIRDQRKLCPNLTKIEDDIDSDDNKRNVIDQQCDHDDIITAVRNTGYSMHANDDWQQKVGRREKWFNANQNGNDFPQFGDGHNVNIIEEEVKNWLKDMDVKRQMKDKDETKNIRDELTKEMNENQTLMIKLKLNEKEKAEIDGKMEKYYDSTFGQNINVLKNCVSKHIADIDLSETEEDDDISMVQYQPGSAINNISESQWMELLQISDQQTFVRALSNILGRKFNEKSEIVLQKNRRNKNKSANHGPDVLKIMHDVAMKKVQNFMQKYKYELNGEEKRDIPCLHIQNGDGCGEHPVIPYSQLSLGQSLVLRTSLLYHLPIDKLTDKLQCKSDLAASRCSELTNSGEIKNTMIQLRSHTLHTINATRKATYFALISHNNNDDHESLYSKVASLLNTQYLDTFGPETDIYNQRFVPIFDNKICIILKSISYDIYTNKIEPKIDLTNEYKCKWIGSKSNLKIFMSSEKDYKYIKEEVKEWFENYTVYLHYLRIINKEKAYKCLVNKHFKDYDWNHQEIGILRCLFTILLKCDTNITSS